VLPFDPPYLPRDDEADRIVPDERVEQVGYLCRRPDELPLQTGDIGGVVHLAEVVGD
jgi:hypothetical protein